MTDPLRPGMRSEIEAAMRASRRRFWWRSTWAYRAWAWVTCRVMGHRPGYWFEGPPGPYGASTFIERTCLRCGQVIERRFGP